MTSGSNVETNMEAAGDDYAEYLVQNMENNETTFRSEGV